MDDLKRDNAWLYLGFSTGVSAAWATGQVTDAFLGSDLMIEDFEGYNGRVSDQSWTYGGTVDVLLPFYHHNDLPLVDADVKNPEKDGYKICGFRWPKAGVFPVIDWQLRKAYILESTPVDPKPSDWQACALHRRPDLHDSPHQHFMTVLAISGRLSSLGQADPEHHLEANKGSGVSIDDSFSMVDVQAKTLYYWTVQRDRSIPV